MSWILFKANVLGAMATGRFSNDPDGFASFYANEYDSCIKRGGDMLYGVNIINGNVSGMVDVIKSAFKKGQESDGENFNLLAEIYPSAFDAYWLGAEMSPFPNPILKPLGWQMTPPAPGAVMNLGPNPIALASSTAINKAAKEAAQALVDELKKQTIDVPGIPVNVYDAVIKLLKKEQLVDEIKNNPAVIAGKAVVEKYNEIKKKKPSIGSQFKPSIKFPFPELPKRKDLIEKAKEKLIEEATAQIKDKLILTGDLPTKEELASMVSDMIKDKIPDIPNVWFIPPTLVLTPSTNIMLDPFVNLAKVHLMGTSGTMNVMAQYPPPAPPAPAILAWSGYNVIG